MNADILRRCEREDELLDALSNGFVPAELSDHARGCLSCAELQLVAGAVLDERSAAIREAAVPTARAMWHRIRIREQQEAQAAARRSLMIGQAGTLAVAVALIAVFYGSEVAMGVRDAMQSIRVSTPFALLLGWWLVAAPVAGWVALRQR